MNNYRHAIDQAVKSLDLESIHSFLHHTDISLALFAAQSVARSADFQFITMLIQSIERLNSSTDELDPRIVQAMLEATDQLLTFAPLSLLLDSSQSDNASVRAIAVEHLSRRNEQETSARLREMISDQDDSVLRSVVRLLLASGDPMNVEALAEAYTKEATGTSNATFTSWNDRRLSILGQSLLKNASVESLITQIESGSVLDRYLAILEVVERHAIQCLPTLFRLRSGVNPSEAVTFDWAIARLSTT